MSVEFTLLYISTVFIASIIPGPSMLLALTHGMQYGAKRTVASAMGNVTVTLVQALISIAGLGTLLIASEIAFQIIKLLGAAYLVYLGINILISPQLLLPAANNSTSDSLIPLRKMYWQAVLVTAGNPKAIVFFTAVFPQFINPNAAYVPQFISLMSIGSVIAFICFMLYAVSGQKLVHLFSRSSFGEIVKRCIGSTFIAAGIGLAIDKK